MADVVINVGAVSAITAGTGLTGGTITGTGTIAADFGTTAGTICQGNDARLTAPVAPLAHASTHTAAGSDPLTLSQSQITDLGTALAAKVATTRQVIAGTGLGGGGALSADVTLTAVYGTSSTSACVGNDARLSNARTPSTHASSHATGGSDVLTLGQAQITNLTTDLAARALGATTMTAGTGLTGGGDLSANRSFAVAYGATSTTATVGNDARLSFVASGTGATTRTLQNKLRDIVSVKDFGAVGDGSTNDTVAINAAIDAALAGNGSLHFPQGIYAMSSTIPAGDTAQISKTLTKNLRITGDNATIKCTRSTAVVFMFMFSADNFGIELDGLTFDLNSIAWVGLRVEDLATSAGFGTKVNEVIVNNCVFENSFKNAVSLDGYLSNGGLEVLGGYRVIRITNSISRNHTRGVGTNTYLNSATRGMIIAQNFSDSVNAFPQNILIDSCVIENIINSETTVSDQNWDCDGIAIFGGFTDSTSFTPCKATVTNSTFINCKGRALKFQCDEIIVTNNQTRFNINCCDRSASSFTLGSTFDIQGCAGNVSNNIFHYERPNGTGNPFSATNTDGATGGQTIFIGFLGVSTPGVRTKRPKSFVVDNNTVYNNVPDANGQLEVFILANEGADSLAFDPNQLPGFLSIKGNRVLGGNVIDFMQLGLRSTASNADSVPPGLSNGIMYVNVIDNFASKMGRSFIACGSNVDLLNNFITCIGNVNATGTVGHLINGSNPSQILPSQMVALGNSGIGLLASKQGAQPNSLLTRVDGIAPMNPVDGNSYGAFSIQTANVPVGTTYTFPRRYGNINGATFLIIGSSINGSVNAMFSFVGNSPGAIQTGWAGSNATINLNTAGTPGAGAPATTANKLNIGRNQSGDNEVQIYNGFTGNPTYTLYTFG